MKKNLVIVVALMMIAMFVVIGCSPNEWTNREIIDGSHIQQGQTVTVQQKNGEQVTGTFIGTSDMPYNEYADYYASSALFDGNGNFLPDLGQNVKFSTVISDRTWEAQLIGFDEQSISVIMKGKSDPEQIYITSLTNLTDKNGDVLHRERFRGLFLDGKIPLRTAIVLTGSSGTINVPINSIKELTVHSGDKMAQDMTLDADQVLQSVGSK